MRLFLTDSQLNGSQHLNRARFAVRIVVGSVGETQTGGGGEASTRWGRIDDVEVCGLRTNALPTQHRDSQHGHCLKQHLARH